MSSECDGQLIRFECDACNETIEIASHDFRDAWEEAKSDGWRCFKDEDEEWTHRCPDCVGQ